MIEEYPDGMIGLSFEDWTPKMMLLSSRLYQLPTRSGDKPTGVHQIGVDKLARLPFGETAIELLCGHVLEGELQYYPDHIELVEIGTALIKMTVDVYKLQCRRKAQRLHIQDRTKPKPTQKYRFVRRK